MYVEVQLRGALVSMLIDTGASHTILSSTEYMSLADGKRPRLEPATTHISLADGSLVDIWGTCWIELKVGGISQSLNVIVADVRMPGVIGMDFLLATGSSIDFRSLQLELQGEGIRCKHESTEMRCARLLATDYISIPAGHEIVVSTEFKQDWSDDLGLVEPFGQCDFGSRGVLVAHSIADPDNNTKSLPVKLCNLGTDTIVINKGTAIARMSPLSSDNVHTMGSLSTSQVSDGEELSADNPSCPAYLQELLESSVKHLPAENHELVQQLFSRYSDVFSSGDGDIGRTSWVKHSIDTGDARPVRQRARRAPLVQQQEIDKQVKDLLERGLISPSSSPWSSPVVLVSKKDGSSRLCCDYRRLNDVTLKDAYPLPRIDASIDALAGASWFSTLDLASGYWQVELDDGARDKSAFAVKGGLYTWNIMSFGLCNAPSTFERLMERVLAGLHWETLLVYLDDIIVWGRTAEEAISRLETVLQRLRAAGLKLKPKKCDLFKQSVTYLGHVVSAEGVHTDPKKIEAVKEWPPPTTVTQVRSFVGLASYYRRFIKDFSRIARPLFRLMEKGVKFDWTAASSEAFHILKEHLITAPVLAYPQVEGQYILDTDASGFALGVVLSQVQDGVERVVAYASKSLNRAQRNYCVTRRELLAVVYAVKQFRQHVYGRPVKVRTDHGALRWLLNFKDPEGQLARWMEVLSTYDLQLEHRPGTQHGNADGLSRMPCRQCGREEVTDPDTSRKPVELSGDQSGEVDNQQPNQPLAVTPPPVQKSVESSSTSDPFLPERRDDTTSCSPPLPERSDDTTGCSATELASLQVVTVPLRVASEALSNDSAGPCCCQIQLTAVGMAPTITQETIKEAQMEDHTLSKIIKLVESGDPRPDWGAISDESSEFKSYWAQWELLEMRHGVLCRKWEPEDGKEVTWKTVIPFGLRETVLEELHSSKAAGHMGETKTINRTRDKYHWVGLRADVRSWVRKCCACAQRKPPPKKRRSKVRQYRVGAPIERVAIDVLGPLTETKGGNRYVLVIGDYFTKWMEAHPMPNQEATTVADVFVREFCCRFGMPKELHSDQGRNFESHVFQETMRLFGVSKTRTCAYNPKSDGMVERYNRTLLAIVSLMLDPIKNQTDWDEQLPFVGFAYRSSRHESTGETPNMMMLGREVRTPVDLVFEGPEGEDDNAACTDYVWELRDRLRQVHQSAREVLKSAAERQKRSYDRTAVGTTYKVNNFVWLLSHQRRVGLSTKLRLPWEGPFLVLAKLSDVHYRIQRSPRSKCKVVHADNMKLYTGPTREPWNDTGELVRNDGEIGADLHVEGPPEPIAEEPEEEEQSQPQPKRNPQRERRTPGWFKDMVQ